MKSLFVVILSLAAISGLVTACSGSSDACDEGQIDVYENGAETPKCAALPKACNRDASCDVDACKAAMYELCSSANVACSDDGQGHVAITCS